VKSKTVTAISDGVELRGKKVSFVKAVVPPSKLQIIRKILALRSLVFYFSVSV